MHISISTTEQKGKDYETIYHKRQINYTLTNSGYYIPNLTITENKPIGKYGMMCRDYLKQHHRMFYDTLLMTGRLNDYLTDIDTQACELKETLLMRYKEQNGVTEQLKADNQMEWVLLMNTIANQIDEVISSQIVYGGTER